MSSSSTLVNVVPDAEQKLVRVLSAASSSTSSPVPSTFIPDCEKCIEEGDAAKLIRTIVDTDGSVTALLKLTADEGVSAVSLLAALLNRVQDDAVSKQLLESLSSSIVRIAAASPTDAKKGISLLATLYNIRPDPNDKVELLIKMIDLAGTQQPQLIDPKTSTLGKLVMDPTYLTTMLDEWNIPPAGRRKLYRSAAAVVKSPTISQHFTLLEVETYTATDVNTVPTCIEAAQKAAIGSIRDPVSLFTLQRKMMSLPAIQALEGKSGPLFGLLKVFQEGNLKDYNAYLQSNGGESVLTQWSLSPEGCSKNMRVLSLCSFASENEEIPYSTVAEKMDVPPTDVEKWVITAVSSGLLSAKMDQMEQKVLVERCVVRKCDIEQWRALQARLHLWRDNIGEVLKQAMKAQSVQ